MSRELFTSWADYQSAIDRLLAMAAKRIWIYDEDLGTLHLETTERIEMLKRPLASARHDCLRIALRNTAPLQQHQPLVQRHRCCLLVSTLEVRMLDPSPACYRARPTRRCG